jgi:glycine betaine/proline transport system permease protein
MADLFGEKLVPLDDWIQNTVEPLAQALRPFFQAVKWPVERMLEGLEHFLASTSPLVVLAVAFIIAWQMAGLGVAAVCVAALVFIGLIGMWKSAMVTVALVVTAVSFSLLIGIPLGLLAGKSKRFGAIVRPVLDVMQTLPAFAYLVPVVILLGIGNVSGVVVTVVFALPPIIRLTDLGVRHVPKNLVEAGYAFGSSSLRVLFSIEVPLAMPSIMAGVNQTLLMALSMTVITSMIAVEGLGMEVLRGIGRLDMGLASTGGIAIVLLAMIFDRTSQGLGVRSRTVSHWTQWRRSKN